MAQYELKSTLKQVKDFDFGGEIVISKLSATKEVVDFHHDRMKKSFPELKEEEIWKRINNIVIRDNIFNEAMKKIVASYEFNINSDDIAHVVQNMKNGNDNFKNANEEILKVMAQRMIEKELIFRDIQKKWKIEVSDDEVKNVLQKMYEQTNYPIRDLINDKEKLQGLKAPILEQKTADELIKKIKYKLDREAIMKNASTSRTAQQPKKDETKK